MRTLPHWANPLPLLGTTLAYYLGLGWLNHARTGANRGECARADKPRLKRPEYRPEPPDEEWCPAHDQWYAAEAECGGCRDEWEQSWTLGEEPGERDSWNNSRAEAEDSDAYWRAFDEAEAANREREDGWYQDLVNRADHPSDPHSGWREGL